MHLVTIAYTPCCIFSSKENVTNDTETFIKKSEITMQVVKKVKTIMQVVKKSIVTHINVFKNLQNV
jgi:uncharacterized membrane protein YjjP (DUF1212 family)